MKIGSKLYCKKKFVGKNGATFLVGNKYEVLNSLRSNRHTQVYVSSKNKSNLLLVSHRWKIFFCI